MMFAFLELPLFFRTLACFLNLADVRLWRNLTKRLRPVGAIRNTATRPLLERPTQPSNGPRRRARQAQPNASARQLHGGTSSS